MKHSRMSHDLWRKNRRAVVAAYDWVSAMVVALAALVLLLTFVFRVVGVSGDSMLPTLQDGDRLLLSYEGVTYSPGDIVVVDRYTDDPLIKRVIAVEGDRITITADYQLYINDQLQSEPYIQGYTVPRDMVGTVTVPEGHVFVMGDNRSVSKDSRMAEIGMVSVKDMVGKVLYCVWPPKSFGDVYDNLRYASVTN